MVYAALDEAPRCLIDPGAASFFVLPFNLIISSACLLVRCLAVAETPVGLGAFTHVLQVGKYSHMQQALAFAAPTKETSATMVNLLVFWTFIFPCWGW